MSIATNQLTTLQLAALIRERPAMFLGNNTVKISNLHSMLWGFSLNAKKDADSLFYYFATWIGYRLGRFGAKAAIVAALLEACGQDEEKAFWYFYELLDEFILLKPVAVHRALLEEENFAFYYDMANTAKSRRKSLAQNRDVLEPAPYELKVIEFSYAAYAFHYDYFFVAGIDEGGRYDQTFDNMRQCKRVFNEKYGGLKWTKIQDGSQEEHFPPIDRLSRF